MLTADAVQQENRGNSAAGDQQHVSDAQIGRLVDPAADVPEVDFRDGNEQRHASQPC
jgi:hypothetical protein